MEQLCKNIYSFPVVLPNSPLKAIHIYVITGENGSYVLDTGYNMKESKESMIAGLKELGLQIKDVSLIVTHLHSDHSGLISDFYEEGCDIYTSDEDGKLLEITATGEYWNKSLDLITKYGIEEEFDVTDNPGYKYQLSSQFEYTALKEGDTIDIGEYCFEVLDLVGHTPGHIGLYERKHKILFCADTILNTITPNITFWGFEYKNMLERYLNTIHKLKKLDVDYCFSTHRDQVTDHKVRIDEITEHHFERLAEVFNSLENGKEYTIRNIASNITWRIRANSWDDFPPAQKYFASGETMAHVELLVNYGYVNMREINGVLYFSKNKSDIDDIRDKINIQS